MNSQQSGECRPEKRRGRFHAEAVSLSDFRDIIVRSFQENCLSSIHSQSCATSLARAVLCRLAGDVSMRDRWVR